MTLIFSLHVFLRFKSFNRINSRIGYNFDDNVMRAMFVSRARDVRGLWPAAGVHSHEVIKLQGHWPAVAISECISLNRKTFTAA